MAEGTYQYECERAELLGIDPPNRAEWEEAERVRKENDLSQQMEDEKINEGSSRMDEITNILSMTQMRLNKFKKVCGSLTNLLKIKGGDGQECSETEQMSGEQATATGSGGGGGGSTIDNQDMQQQMSSGIDKLDSLLTKTENAQYAMAHQSKQMKSFLQ